MRRMTLFTAIAAMFFMAASCSPAGPADPQVEAARALAQRVVGPQASHFVFEKAEGEGDFFRLEQRGRKLAVIGNDANSMAVGLNHYLKYYCHVEYGWLAGDTFTLPKRLPAVPEPVEARARVRDRFFLNYCTYGYTMPWWQWSDWEHFIDWMALNGINLPLSITGQESIWYQIWTEMGLTDEEVRQYFTGPAHLPWHRMQNIDRWFGPLPKSWLDGQLALQKQIVARERELDMKPVLPAFSGHVPRELARLYPDAPLTKNEDWSGYTPEYSCSFLDPMSSLFSDIQKKFVEKETEIYGTDHVYGIDIFNELTPPSWEPDYLARVSRQVYESLEQADPEAVWLQMGWLFYNERKYWTEDRVEAYLTSFPKERQILLDYFCERQEVWKRTDRFYGVPYIWCYLGNFGGNTALVGRFRDLDEKIENALVNGGGNLCGLGSTLEGFDCNPYVYEFIFEKAWDLPQHRNLDRWTEALADQRTGVPDSHARAAWKLLIDSVYVDSATPGQASFVNQRPAIGRSRTRYANARLLYDNRHLCTALGLLLEADGRNNAYSFDLANLTRQLLANEFDRTKGRYEAAVAAGDRAQMKELSAGMLEILDDIDRVLGTQGYFLVGKWISDARSWGADEAEKAYFERNARNLITTWSDKDMLLNDYASRTWNGLVRTYYKVRWEKFFAAVESAMDADGSFDEEDYAAFSDEVTAYEKQWWDERLYDFPSTPAGDAKAVAAELYAKYRERIIGPTSTSAADTAD